MHYYYNLKTNAVQWHKPYCLRSQDLRPFMGYDEAAFKIQNIYHVRKAHKKVVGMIREQYDKIYDRTSGHFYYFYNGHVAPTPEDPRNRVRSFLANPVMWKKVRRREERRTEGWSVASHECCSKLFTIITNPRHVTPLLASLLSSPSAAC